MSVRKKLRTFSFTDSGISSFRRAELFIDASFFADSESKLTTENWLFK